MEIGLMSNDLDIMEIHLVVVFVDMAGAWSHGRNLQLLFCVR